jgi:thiol-disulfide isomerase/thioredoxin
MELSKQLFKVVFLSVFFVSTTFSQDIAAPKIAFQEKDSNSDSSLVGKDAPGIYLLDLDGDDFFLSQILNKDKFIFINFFATWCAPCIEELPDLNKLYKENSEKMEMVIIDVNNLTTLNNETGNVEAKEEKVEDVVKALENLDVIKLYDTYTTVAVDYKISDNPVLPQSFLLSSGGIVLWESRGRLNGEELEELNKMIGTNK